MERESHLLLHGGDTAAALNVLGGILTSGQEDGRDNVRGVGVETTQTSSHSTSDQVLADVQLNERVDITLEDALDNVTRDDSLSHDRLTTTISPVDGSGLLISTEVTRKRDDSHVIEATLLGHDIQGLLTTLG